MACLFVSLFLDTRLCPIFFEVKSNTTMNMRVCVCVCVCVSIGVTTGDLTSLCCLFQMRIKGPLAIVNDSCQAKGGIHLASGRDDKNAEHRGFVNTSAIPLCNRGT